MTDPRHRPPPKVDAPVGARVCVGAVIGAFGVRGEARIKSFTDDPAAIAAYGPLFTEDGRREFRLTLTRPLKDGFAAHLSGVRTREEAEALKGTRLYADRAALPQTGEEEYYHADLIGMTVTTAEDAELGRVRSVQNYGAGDFLEIEIPGAQRTALLPFTVAAVPVVDPKAGRLIADPPAGVFDDEDEPGPEVNT